MNTKRRVNASVNSSPNWKGSGKRRDRLSSGIHIIEVPVNFVGVKLSSSPPDPMLEHAIRLRAYELYVQRGMVQGHAIDDWLKAEAELVHGHCSFNSTP